MKSRDYEAGRAEGLRQGFTEGAGALVAGLVLLVLIALTPYIIGFLYNLITYGAE